jgi:hypothetical protein
MGNLNATCKLFEASFRVNFNLHTVVCGVARRTRGSIRGCQWWWIVLADCWPLPGAAASAASATARQIDIRL